MPQVTDIRRSASMPLAVKRMVAQELVDYSKHKRALAEYYEDETPSPVQRYSLTAGVQSGGGEHRPIEDLTMRMADDPYLTYLQKSVRAVETLLEHADEADRKLIRLCYMSPDTVSIEAAADRLYMSKNTAYRRLNAQLEKLAQLLGYIPAKSKKQ